MLRLQRVAAQRQLVVRLLQRLGGRQSAATDERGERVGVAAGGADGALEGNVLRTESGKLLAQLGELLVGSWWGRNGADEEAL